MSRRSLPPDTLLAIEISAICSRNRYTRDPQPVVDELLRAAGSRGDLLAREVESWVTYYDSSDTHTVAAALLERIPGAAAAASAPDRRR